MKLSERSIRIKELINGEVCMGTYGLVELELLEFDKQIEALKQTEVNKLALGDVSGSLQPLTIDRVSKMLNNLSKETWIASKGNDSGWADWWKERNKQNINRNDR